MPPLSRIAALTQDPGPDFPAIIERIKRSCGTNTPDLAAALQMKPRRLNDLERGELDPTWCEGNLLLRALEACGRDRAR